MKTQTTAFTIATLATLSLFADQPPVEEPKIFTQWFTGPLLTPTSTVIPKGHWNIEPYLFVITKTANYTKNWGTQNVRNFQTVQLEVPMQIGLLKRLDMQLTPKLVYQQSTGRTANQFDDLPLSFDYQLFYADDHGWRPKAKISAGFQFPLAKYQKLNPEKVGTDAIGSGSFAPFVGTTLGRVIHIYDIHFLSLRFNFTCNLPNTVHVRGYNAYGGGKGTAGKVRIGTQYTALIGMEYNLTQNWALAFDFDYQHNNKITFKGTEGVSSTGAPAVTGAPSSEQISIAPAIEYNWNANVGLIAGIWFTVAGRNSSDFYSPVVALNVFH